MTLVDQLRAVMTADAIGIARCPCCNSDAAIEPSGFFAHKITCSVCGLTIRSGRNPEFVKDAWNTRAYRPLIHSLLAVIAEAHEALEEVREWGLSNWIVPNGRLEQERVWRILKNSLATTGPLAKLAREG